jgi:hypothetical protein
MRNTEEGLKRIRKAMKALDETDPRSPLVRANNFLMDWLDSAIIYRDDPANWIDGNEDEQSSN